MPQEEKHYGRMRFTILLIAVFVANEILNRGYPLTATALLIVAVGEAFLVEWIEQVTQRIRTLLRLFMMNWENAAGTRRLLLSAVFYAGAIIFIAGNVALLVFLGPPIFEWAISTLLE